MYRVKHTNTSPGYQQTVISVPVNFQGLINTSSTPTPQCRHISQNLPKRGHSAAAVFVARETCVRIPAAIMPPHNNNYIIYHQQQYEHKPVMHLEATFKFKTLLRTYRSSNSNTYSPNVLSCFLYMYVRVYACTSASYYV